MRRNLCQFVEAEEVAAEAANLLPRDPDIAVSAAWVVSLQGRDEEALTHVERALSLNPNHSGALDSRIDFLRYLRWFAEAEEAVTQAADLLPRDPDIAVSAAWVASSQGDDEKALTHVERALALHPRDSWALQSQITFLRNLSRFPEAEEAAAEAADLLPRDPGMAVSAAWVASRQGDDEKALTHVERALALHPRDSWALQSQIALLRNLSRFPEAEEAAAEAADLLPRDPDIAVSAAWVVSLQDRDEEALTHVERALSLNPNHSGALRSRIDILRYLRRFAEGEEAVTQAADLLPRDPDIAVSAAWVVSLQGRDEEALTHVERALSLEPNHSWVLRSRIDILRYLRRFAEAEEAVTQAADLLPRDPDIAVSAAWVVSLQDRDEEALTHVERALSLNPNHSGALRSRIDILRYLRRFAEAEEAVAQAADLLPRDPDIAVSAAWVVSLQGRDEEALTHVERALSLNPNHSWVLRSRIDILRYLRRFAEAEEAVTQAADLLPRDPDIAVSAAWVVSLQDRDEEALTHVNVHCR